MTDAPKIVVTKTKEPAVSPDKKPDAVGPVAATPVVEPVVATK